LDGLDKLYLDGELFTSTEYKNGKKDGLDKQYYKGELLFTHKYKDGEMN
jgi:antitoxin component YwqK of YwqJK toxin-antitoxin module